jgi:hypothetical protein
MDSVYIDNVTGLRAVLIHGAGIERECAEHELLEAGVCLPLPHRSFWLANGTHDDRLFLLIRDTKGTARGGLEIEQIHPRTMPGHVILQVRMFGGNLSGDVCRVALQALRAISLGMHRVLRLNVRVFSRDAQADIANTMREIGYCEVRKPTRYRHTLAIDLRPTEEEIFASISKGTRRKIKDAYKLSAKSVSLTDPSYVGRLADLQQESLDRTGGKIADMDWENVLRMSKEHPGHSQVLGAFVGDDISPDHMYAFGWACCHGKWVEHRSMGTTRQEGMRVPVGHMLVWDLVRWAKTTGAEWFDMGGITLGNPGEEALEGISNFKRLFSNEVLEVGSEWMLEPRPRRARIADVLSRSFWGIQHIGDHRIRHAS